MRYTVDERQERIIELLKESGTLRVTELASRLDISIVTARRDVEALASQGLLERARGTAFVPGGAGPVERSAQSSPDALPAPPAAGAVIGMVVPHPQHYFGEVIRGAREAVHAAGGRLVLGFSGYQPDQDTARAERMLESGVDGLLLTPSWMTEQGNEGLHFAEFAVPTVLIERRPAVGTQAAMLDRVSSSHHDGAGLAVAHLVGLGHERIGLVAGISPLAVQLEAGYEAALRSFGLRRPKLETVGMYSGMIDQQQLDQAADRIAAAVAAQKVSAVLVLSDADAIVLLESLRTRHPAVRVPQDLAVVAYDDEVAALSDLPLTAVAPPKYEVGRAAVGLLNLRLHERATGVTPSPRRHLDLLPELRVRQSCGANSA